MNSLSLRADIVKIINTINKMILKNFFSKKPHLVAARYAMLALAAISMSTGFVSCSDDDDDLLGNWVLLSTMNGSKRSQATGTTVEVGGVEYGFIGTGLDNDGDPLVDFWKYNPLLGGSGSWEPVADFPGIARWDATSFSLNGKLYVGAGYTDIAGQDAKTVEYLKDFYMYDPSTDQWTAIDDLPTSAVGLRGCTSFVLDNKAFVCFGHDGKNEYKEIYVFDGATQSWAPNVTTFPGQKLKGAAAFVIDDLAYVGAGVSNGSYRKEFYSFDGENWTKLHALISDDNDDYSKDDDYDNNIVRSYTATFVMNGCGYFATATMGSASQSVWEYRPSDDRWVEKTSFEGASRNGAVGFTINGVGFVATGGSSAAVYDDIWRFEPNADQSDSDN